MKTLNVLCALFFMLNIAVAQDEPCCENECDNISIYGDANDNAPSQIKHYAGSTYLAGTITIGDQIFATFTKFDSNNNIIWEYQFDRQSRIADFIKTGNDLLLVGRTEPTTDNELLFARIDDNGNAVFIRTYNNTSRELFLRIVEHPNPQNPAFPFYATSLENNTASPSVFDDSRLYNVDIQGNINWAIEYEFGQQDEQIDVGLGFLSDGNLLVSGNAVDSSQGIIAKVNGATGQIISSNSYSIACNYNQVYELSNGNIIASAFLTPGSEEVLVSLFDNGLNLLSSMRLDATFRSGFLGIMDIDNADNVYIGGTVQSSGQPILCKFNTTANMLTLTASKFFNGGETSFAGLTLDVNGNQIYYADGRTGNPLSTGGSDILLGYFDTALTDDCLMDAGISTSVENYGASPITIPLFVRQRPKQYLH